MAMGGLIRPCRNWSRLAWVSWVGARTARSNRPRCRACFAQSRGVVSGHSLWTGCVRWPPRSSTSWLRMLSDVSARAAERAVSAQHGAGRALPELIDQRAHGPVSGGLRIPHPAVLRGWGADEVRQPGAWHRTGAFQHAVVILKEGPQGIQIGELSEVLGPDVDLDGEHRNPEVGRRSRPWSRGRPRQMSLWLTSHTSARDKRPLASDRVTTLLAEPGPYSSIAGRGPHGGLVGPGAGQRLGDVREGAARRSGRG